MSAPDIKEAFAVATSSPHRVNLEERGVDVRRDQPSGGAIGMSALWHRLHQCLDCPRFAQWQRRLVQVETFMLPFVF